jgi:homoserine kinase
MPEQISVRVPATIANLGCLFDSAAIAVGLYLDLRISPRKDHATAIKYQGTNPDRIPLDDTNLIARTMRETLHNCGKHRGFDLEIENQIPVGVGLGSSAAAIVGGLAACHWLAGKVFLDDELISMAARLEGHPDNVATAWLGGFTLSVELENRVVSCSCPIPDTMQLVVVVPDYPLSTEKARQLLPNFYSRADAVHNLQRAAIVAASVFSRKAELRRFLFDDRWHQPYRAPLIPGLTEVLQLKMPGLLGVCLSGAGPSVLALAKENGAAIGEKIREMLKQHGVSSEALSLAPDNKGAKGWSVPA